MLTKLFWIPTPFPGRLAIAPRPRGGDWLDDEIREWRASQIDVVVSLLTHDEAAEFDLDGEAAAGAKNGIRFLSFPIMDRDVPASRVAFGELVSEVVRELSAGHGVAVHCRQGIGRAGLVAASVLVAAGLEPDVAIERVSAARGCSVPETAAQRSWLEGFAEAASIESRVS